MTVMALRFSTPTIVATPAALSLLSHLGENPMYLVRRHFAGEWGGDADNGQVNERYLAGGGGHVIVYLHGRQRADLGRHPKAAALVMTLTGMGERPSRRRGGG